MHIRSLLALTALLTGCAGNDMQTSGAAYVPVEALASYQTYAWSPKRTLSLRDPSLNTPTIQGWLDSAVENELRSKGYVKVAPGSSPNFLVTYAAGSRTISGSREFSTRDEWSGNRGDEEGGTGALAQSRMFDTDYEQGRLIIDLVDRKSGKTVYRGSSEVAMLNQPSSAKSVPRINRMVKDMLKAFPRR